MPTLTVQQKIDEVAANGKLASLKLREYLLKTTDVDYGVVAGFDSDLCALRAKYRILAHIQRNLQGAILWAHY